MTKKALMCHYRVGRTDGVSLEIDKRTSVLKELGWDVYLLAGPGSDGADFIIPELDFDRSDAKKIGENAFGSLVDYENEQLLLKEIRDLSGKIEQQLCEIVNSLKPDFILIHNIFSHGRHIASALAFHQLLRKKKIPALATHHDFYWEREVYSKPSCGEIRRFLRRYVPPNLPGLKHAVISKNAAASLFSNTHINAVVMPDTLDFSMTPWSIDEYNKDLFELLDVRENDILILQATRVVKRKGIELLLPILEKLNNSDYIGQIVGKQLYNGKTVTENSKFVFIIAGYAENEAEDYLNAITSGLNTRNIPFRDIHTAIAAKRERQKTGKKYSLFDTYPFADIVSYPSLYEGWGNQFLEAVFAKKPIISYEYPVFLSDIKPDGYEVISLGSQVTTDTQTGFMKLPEQKIENVCENIIETLVSKNTIQILENNFSIGKANNSKETLTDVMSKTLAIA